MLNGLDPVIIIHLKKLTSATTELAKVPLQSVENAKVRKTFAVVPIYLSQQLTGLIYDSGSKNIDIETNQTGQTDGNAPLVAQKPLSAITTINLTGTSDSIGVQLLAAFAEILLEKVSSQEYEVTYVNGATTLFGGLLHSLEFSEGSDDNLIRIKVELTRGNKDKKTFSVQNDPNAVRLGTTGTTPPANPTSLSAQSTSSATSIAPKPSAPVGIGGLL